MIRYNYDPDNRLISVESEEGGRVEFAYDAFGRRIAKETKDGKVGFLWDGDVLLSEQNGERSSEYVFSFNGYEPLCRFDESDFETYHNDYLGTPRELTDELGRVVWSSSYDVHGQISDLHVDKRENHLRFPGQYEDAETGLFYNFHRYYDPASGRYINKDPIGLLGGLNHYEYTHNPINWSDPLGLDDVFRGDDFYKGGDMGLPLGSEADIMTPWEHVRRESNQSSIFTSFSDTRASALKFTKGNNVYKVSMDDLRRLETEGVIKIHTPESVAEAMKSHPKRKIRIDANNVKQIMEKNGEILVEGQIPSKYIHRC